MAGLGDKLAKKATALGAAPAATDTPLATQPASKFLEVDPARIEANPDQPRREFDQAALEALAASIAEHGVLEPLLVRLEAGRVVLIAGERRLRAARLAGLALVPCTVNQDGDSAILALVENLHREDLTPLEEAEALASLQRQRGLSLADLAEIARKSVSTVSEILSLASLPAQVKAAVADQPERFPRRLLVEMAKEDPSRAVLLAGYATHGREVRAEDLRAERRERKAAAKTPGRPSPAQEASEAAKAEALIRRAETLAGELMALDFYGLTPNQCAQLKDGLQPLARALDNAFLQAKRVARENAKRWTPDLRARLLGLVSERGLIQARIIMGQELNEDGLPLHPSEADPQIALAEQEAQA